MKKRHLILLVVTVLLLSLSLSAYAKVKVEFWHGLGGHTGSHILQQFIDDFNASQDEVEVVAVYQGNYDDTLNKYRLAVQAGTPPHLVHVYEIGTRLIDLDSSVSLQPFLDRGDLSLTTWLKTSCPTIPLTDSCIPCPLTSNPIIYYNRTCSGSRP